MATPPWTDAAIQRQTKLILDSYRQYVGCDLLSVAADIVTDEQLARQLFEAPFVVVSHGTEADPILTYGNAIALELWETDFATLTSLPSRKTAEPMHRDERADMLRRTREQGFIDDYQGVRISTSGARFRIDRATVWNLVDERGEHAGQAATFSTWTPLAD